MRHWSDLTVEVSVNWGAWKRRLIRRPGQVNYHNIGSHVGFMGRILQAYFTVELEEEEALTMRDRKELGHLIETVQEAPDPEGLREIIRMVLCDEYSGFGEEQVGYIEEDIKKWLRGDDRKGENGNG